MSVPVPETDAPAAAPDGMPGGAPRRRRSSPDGYAKGRARRRQVIEAATELYGEVGYRSASLREVAARAGLSHPGLLHHFGTKEALLLAVLEQRDEDDTAAFVEGRRGMDALVGMVDIVERNTHRPAIVELFCVLSAEATSPDHPAHAWFRQRYETVLAFAADAYRAAREDGHLRAEVDPEDAARRLVALMDGLQVQFLYDRVGTDMVARLRDELRAELVVPLP